MKINPIVMHLKPLSRWLLVVFAFLVSSGAGRAQQPEQEVKAAFLYKFTKFVEWPREAFNSSNALVIGIVGQDSLGGALDNAVEGKTTGGRRIVVKHLKWNQDLDQCQILFIPRSELKGAEHLAHLKKLPILVVGESTGFARRTGIVNFIIEDDSVCFEINVQSARDAGLTISSKLLSLAKVPAG